MAGWQKTYLERKKAVTTTSTSGTVTVDLPEKDYISELLITAFHTNTTLTNALIPVYLAIKKIEVLDGSEVIKSLSGRQTQALAYYHGRTPPMPHRKDWESTETYDHFAIRFGRNLKDMEYMLNMGKMTNPQLKIEYDFVTTSYYGVSHTVPTSPTFKYSVLATIWRGATPKPVLGYIRSQQIYDWTQVATGTEYVDIPRTEPIVGLMCQGGQDTKRLLQDFNRVRLNINNAELIPLDVYEEELQHLQKEWFEPLIVAAYRVEYKDGKDIDSGFGFIEGVSVIKRGSPIRVWFVEGQIGGILDLACWDLATPTRDTTSGHGTRMIVKGLFPHHTIYIPAEKVSPTGEFTLPAPDYAKIVLELTSSSASTSAIPNVVLETLGVQK